MPETQSMLTTLSQLPSTVFTSEDLAAVISALQTLQLQQTNSLPALDAVSEVYKPVLLEALTLRKSSGQNAFIALLHQLENLPTATLTVAYQPTHRQVIALCRTVRRSAHPATVLEIIYDPTINAGCIVEFQGKRIDRSVARLLGNTTIL